MDEQGKDQRFLNEREIPERIIRLLENAEFLCIATRDKYGNPCVANKFLIQCRKNSLYISDFAKGKTWTNLKAYPKISVAIMDAHNLIDYQINGRAILVNPGPDLKELKNAFSTKESRFSAKRLIEAVRKEKTQHTYQFPLPRHIVI
jgi:uncharacterized pyridoxamine 5'-phosphate oxidase family protein